MVFSGLTRHTYENPTAWSNFLTCMNILIFPLSLIVMFGVMLKNMRHAMVIIRHDDHVFRQHGGWAIYCGHNASEPYPGCDRPTSSRPSNGRCNRAWRQARD